MILRISYCFFFQQNQYGFIRSDELKLKVKNRLLITFGRRYAGCNMTLEFCVTPPLPTYAFP
jgi:hypothetical protein